MKAFTIYCSTGCTCCSNENHYRGPFSSREIAEEKVKHFREVRLLASQYSKNGNYHIYEEEAEQLPDGRVIVDDRVFPGFADQPLENADEDKFRWE